MDVALAFMTDGCYEGYCVDIYISQKKFRIKKTQKKGFGGTKEPHQKSSDAKPGNNE